MKKNSRTISSKRPYVTIVITLIIIAIALFLLKNAMLNNKKSIANNASIGQPNSSQPAAENPIQPELSAVDSTLITEPKIPKAQPSPPEGGSQPTILNCQKLSDELLLFFKHLDNQEYIKAYTQKEPTQKYLSSLITKILDHPPVNQKETADILTVLKNASHFFQVIGLKDLSLLRDILTNEHSSLEQQLASFYAWSTVEKDCHSKASIQVQFPLAKTYEYAAFFLNTLGGQAYLSRRDPTVRILTRYYCVLILNQASQQSINKYNINLPYHLKAVINDISTSDFLENQSTYLDNLKKIKVGV